MIFVDGMKKSIALGMYWQIFLLNNLKDRGNDVIKSFSFILEKKTKTNRLENFLNSNTKIIIYTDIIKMEIDIPNIRYIIQ